MRKVMAAMAVVWAGTALADTAEINGANLYFETVGDGPAVMVLHGGLGLDSTYLRPWFDRLADDHTVIYYDHFGNGRSEYPEDWSALTMDRLVSDADALREHLGHDKVVMIGHSYGGFIAQAYAAAHQDHLTGLALVDTAPVLDYAPTLSGNEEQMAALGAVFSGPAPDNETFRKNWNLIIQMYFKEFDPTIGARLDEATTYSYMGWNMAAAILQTFNMLDALPGIHVPTLAIAGAHDGITPPGPGAERIGGLVPGAQVVIFENSAHYPFIEEEDAFFDTLGSWMAGLQ